MMLQVQVLRALVHEKIIFNFVSLYVHRRHRSITESTKDLLHICILELPPNHLNAVKADVGFALQDSGSKRRRTQHAASSSNSLMHLLQTTKHMILGAMNPRHVMRSKSHSTPRTRLQALLKLKSQ
jgi:hypothetical protein